MLWQLLFGLWKKRVVSYVKWDEEYPAFDVAVKLKRNVYGLLITAPGKQNYIYFISVALGFLLLPRK